MAETPLTPGQKAARARDRERFAARLAANEAEADRVHARLLNGDRLARRGGDETFAFPDGERVAAAVVSILHYRRSARLEGDALIPCAPEGFDRLH